MNAGSASSIGAVPAAEKGSQVGFADGFVFLPLLCLWAFLVQFGSLNRFSAEGGGLGLTTLIVVVVLLFGGIKTVNGVVQEQTFWWLLPFVAYLFIPSLLSAYPVETSFKIVQLLGYVLVAATVSRVRFSEAGLGRLWLALGLGMLVSAGLTIIDFVGIIDVPRNNEVGLSSKVTGERIEQASGFFPTRSFMAAIFCLGTAGSAVLAISRLPAWRRLFFAAAGLTGILCLFLTHNRSGILGPAAAVALLILFSPQFSGVRKLGSFAAALVLGAVFLAIASLYFPEHLAVYAASLGFLGSSEIAPFETDLARIEFFFIALQSVASDPLGHSFTLMPYKMEMKDTHNVVTSLIWAGGIITLLWLPAFAVFITGRLRSLGRPGSPYHTAIACALVSWLLNGMVHNILFAGLAWVFIGILLSRLHFEQQATPTGLPSASRPALPIESPWVPRDERI